MEEENLDVAEDTSSEVEEDTNISEDSAEDTVDLAEKVEKAEQFARTAVARAKKAEEELKALKAKPHINNQDPQLSDELKLIARGLSDEEIDKAKVIAKGADMTLQEAIKDPLFLSYQTTLKEKERKEKAKLGASKGSGESQDESLIKPEMSRDEHEKAFKKVMGM